MDPGVSWLEISAGDMDASRPTPAPLAPTYRMTGCCPPPSLPSCCCCCAAASAAAIVAEPVVAPDAPRGTP